MSTSLGITQYAGANARVRGLYSRLLDKDVWRELLSAEDFNAALEILKNTHYERVIRALEQRGGITLEQLERYLWGEAASNCRKVMVFTGGGVRILLTVWWQHFELENLKALFRGLDQQMDPNVVNRFLIPLGTYSTLPWEALLHERTVSGLIDRLRNTHYINPLRAAYPRYQRERSLFPIEVALDIRYYRDLARAIYRLTGSDRLDAKRVLGTRLDMLNILWAFRYRIYYNLSAEEIVNYTIWHAVRTDTQIIQEIALGADPRDILVRIWGEEAFDLSQLTGSDETRMLPKLELLLERFWRRLAQEALSGYPFKLGSLLGYLVLNELEVQDIVTLLEAKGMGWEPERIKEHLIRSEE
ncbi:MAG: V-type ATPase subunit [Anaerolineae bacterium]|nr:V-type ATPase subunit [Anaerolineae bacterium]